MDENAPDQPRPYLLTEAASLTGLSVDALRKRILRRKVRATRSNEDGLWRVWLTAADIETAKAGRLAGQEMDSPSEESWTINALQAEAATLREALARERSRADQAEAMARADRMVVTETVTEREEARVRAAAAEAEAKALRAEVEWLRRPAWRRWLGR